MAATDAAINIRLNPVIDVPKFNAMIQAIKSALGSFGSDIKLIDAAKLSEDVRKVAQESRTLVGELKSVQEQGSNVEKAFKFNQITQAVTQFAGAMQSVLAVGNEYEATLAAVGAVTGQSGDALTNLGNKARELALQFGGSASDQLKSFQGILSKLGPQVADNADALKAMGNTVNILSAASGDDAATSMNALVDTMLQLGLTTGDAAKDAATMAQVADALAASAKVGAAEIPQVAQSMLQVGVAAKGAKMDLSATTAAIQVLAVGGKTGSEAGVALRNVLGLIQKASGPAEAAMQKMGTSSKELGEILTTQGLDVALAKIKSGMNGLGSAAEKNATLMTIFGTENSAAAGILLDNLDQFKTFQEGISDAVSKGASGTDGAVAQANARLGTAEAISKRIKAQVEDVFIGISQTLGSGFSAILTSTAQLAPTISTVVGIKNIIPEGLVGRAKDFALQILTKIVPGLFATATAQGAVAASSGVAAAGMVATGAAATGAGAAAGGTASAFGAMWVAITGPVGIVIAAIAAIGIGLYALYTNVEGFRNAVDGALNFIAAGWDIISPLFSKIGSVLVSIGEMVFTWMILPYQIAWDIIKSVADAIFSTGDSVNESSGALRALGVVVEFISNEFNKLKALFDGVKAAIASLREGIGPVISAIAKGDFTGAISAIGDLGKNASKAFQGAFVESYQNSTAEDLKNKLAKDLEGGVTINAKLEANANFDDLLSRYDDVQKKIAALTAKKASGQNLTKDEQQSLKDLQAEAERTSQQIAKIAPSAKENMQVVVTESGRMKETFSINTAAAREFASAQKQAYQGDFKQSQQDISKNLQTQSAIYADQKKKLDDVAKAAQNAAKSGKSDEARKLIKDYEELKKSVDEKGQALAKSFNDAGKAGLVTEDAIKKVSASLGLSYVEAKKNLVGQALKDATKEGKITDVQIATIAERFGISTKAAKGMWLVQQQQTGEAKNTAAEVATIAESFDKAKDAAETSVKDALGKAKTLALQLEEARARGDKNEAARLSKELSSAIKVGEAKVTANKRLDKISEEIEIATGAREKKKEKKDSESVFAAIKKKDEQTKKEEESALALAQLQDILSGKRVENDQTELLFEQQKLDAMRKRAVELTKALKIEDGKTLAIENVRIKVKPTERGDVAEYINNFNLALGQQQLKMKKLEVKLGVDAEKLKAEMRKIELENLEQGVDIKVAFPGKLPDLEKKLSEVQNKMDEQKKSGATAISADLIAQEKDLSDKILAVRSDAYKQATETLKKQTSERRTLLINEYQKDIDALQVKLDAAKQAGDAATQLALIKQLQELQKKQDKVRKDAYSEALADLQDAQKAEQDALNQRFQQRKAWEDRINAMLQSSANVGIDKRIEEESRILERQKEQDLISEETYNERKAELEQDAIAQKEALQAIARGRELENERQHSVALLEEERKRIADKLDLATKNNDTESVKKYTAELNNVTTQLTEKTDIMFNLKDEAQGLAGDLLGGILTFDEDAIKSPLRKMFGILAGFLQRLASAKATEVLLGSLVGATGFTGLLTTFLLKPLIDNAIGLVINPILSSILSFSTGGVVSSPTLAWVGDRNNNGSGDQTEFILGSDQLQLVIIEAIRPIVQSIREGFAMLAGKLDYIQFNLRVSGQDLVSATDRTRTANMGRVKVPYGTLTVS